MPSCDTCRYRRGYMASFQGDENRAPVPAGGWCHKLPPRVMDNGAGSFPPISLAAWCGEYRPAIRRIIGRLFGRKD